MNKNTGRAGLRRNLYRLGFRLASEDSYRYPLITDDDLDEIFIAFKEKVQDTPSQSISDDDLKTLVGDYFFRKQGIMDAWHEFTDALGRDIQDAWNTNTNEVLKEHAEITMDSIRSGLRKELDNHNSQKVSDKDG